MVAPSALMLFCVVVSALRMMSSRVSATLRTRPALISGSMATTPSSSRVKLYGAWPTSSCAVSVVLPVPQPGVRRGDVLGARVEAHVTQLRGHVEGVGGHRKRGHQRSYQRLQVYVQPQLPRLERGHKLVAVAGRRAVQRGPRHRLEQRAPETLVLAGRLGVHREPRLEPAGGLVVRGLHVGGRDATDEPAFGILGALDPRGAEALAPLGPGEPAHQRKVQNVHAGVGPLLNVVAGCLLDQPGEHVAPPRPVSLLDVDDLAAEPLDLLAQQPHPRGHRVDPLPHESVDLLQVLPDYFHVRVRHLCSPFPF